MGFCVLFFDSLILSIAPSNRKGGRQLQFVSPQSFLFSAHSLGLLFTSPALLCPSVCIHLLDCGGLLHSLESHSVANKSSFGLVPIKRSSACLTYKNISIPSLFNPLRDTNCSLSRLAPVSGTIRCIKNHPSPTFFVLHLF